MEIKRHKMLATMVRGSLLNNRHISAWTLLTLATCAALVTLFTTMTAEVGHKLSHELRTLGTNAVAYPTGENADWTRLDKTTHSIGAKTAQLVLRVRLFDGQPIGVITADPQKMAELTPYWRVNGSRPRAPGECLAGRRLADQLGWKIGQKIDLGGEQRQLVGIAETGDEDEDRVFVSSSAAAADGFHYALISVPGGEAGIEKLQRTLAADQAGIEIKPLRQVLFGEQHVLAKVNVLFVTTLAVVLVLTALGVSASMLARVVERRKEFALLRAIGANKSAVAVFLLAESAAVGIVGALAGFVVGTGLSMLVVARIFHVAVSPQWLAFVIAMATTLIVALLAGGLACTRTLRWLPATALRGE